MNADDYTIDTDKSRLDLPFVHHWLSESSYWAKGRSYERVVRSVENSLCFGVYDPAGRQVGFARVVTDRVSFGWLCDLFIAEDQRGRGLAKRLVETVLAHPDLRELKRLLLATRDAHELYRRCGGFVGLKEPQLWMERSASS
jgi:GNAT superfamily N-acetyltransferase